MNAQKSTAIDFKLATLIFAGLYELSIDAAFNTYARLEAGVTAIGSSKATLTAGKTVMGCNWNLRELHGYNNRYNNARIYKTGKLVRKTDKYALADAVNFESVEIEPEVVEYEPLDSFIEANLICGCEVTILENGEQFIARCDEERCYSHKFAA